MVLVRKIKEATIVVHINFFAVHVNLPIVNLEKLVINGNLLNFYHPPTKFREGNVNNSSNFPVPSVKTKSSIK